MALPLPACRSPDWGQCCWTLTPSEPLTPIPEWHSRLVPTWCQQLFGNWTGHKYRHSFWRERGNVYKSPTLKMTSSCSWDAEVIPVFHPLQDNHKEERQNVGQRKSCDSKHYAHFSASLGTTTHQPLLQALQLPGGCTGPAQRLSLPSRGILLVQCIVHFSLSTLFFLNSVAIPFEILLRLSKTSNGWYHTLPNGNCVAAAWHLTVLSCRWQLLFLLSETGKDIPIINHLLSVEAEIFFL